MAYKTWHKIEPIEKPDDSSAISRGIKSGVDSTQGALYGFMGLLAGAANLKNTQEALVDKAQENFEEAGKNAGPRFTEMGLSEAPEWAIHSISSLLPTAMLGLGAGAVGKKVASKAIQNNVEKYITKKVLNKAGEKVLNRGMKAGVVAGMMPIESGSNYAEDAIKHGAENAQVLPALLTGTAAAGLEIVGGNFRLIEKVLGPKTAKAYKVISKQPKGNKLAKKILKEAVIQAPQEALQEFTQEFLSSVNEKITATPEEQYKLLSKENILKWIDAGAVGGLAGSVGAIPTSLWGKNDSKSDSNTEDREQDVNTEEILKKAAEMNKPAAQSIVKDVIPSQPEGTGSVQPDMTLFKQKRSLNPIVSKNVPKAVSPDMNFKKPVREETASPEPNVFNLAQALGKKKGDPVTKEDIQKIIEIKKQASERDVNLAEQFEQTTNPIPDVPADIKADAERPVLDPSVKKLIKRGVAHIKDRDKKRPLKNIGETPSETAALNAADRETNGGIPSKVFRYKADYEVFGDPRTPYENIIADHPTDSVEDRWIRAKADNVKNKIPAIKEMIDAIGDNTQRQVFNKSLNAMVKGADETNKGYQLDKLHSTLVSIRKKDNKIKALSEEIGTKKGRGLDKYNKYISKLSDEQKSSVADLIVENPKSPSIQLIKIKKAIEKAQKLQPAQAPSRVAPVSISNVDDDIKSTRSKVPNVDDTELDSVLGVDLPDGGEEVSQETDSPKIEIKDYPAELIKIYEKAGWTATWYPKKKQISVNGRTMSEKEAIAKMESALYTPEELQRAKDFIPNEISKKEKPIESEKKKTTLYHGTEKEFSVFDPNLGELGNHFASEEIAKEFAGENGKVIKAEVTLKNPYDIVSDIGDWNDMEMLREYLSEANEGPFTDKEFSKFKTSKDVRNGLIEKGYDGIKYQNSFEGDTDHSMGSSSQDSYIVFSPESIKVELDAEQEAKKIIDEDKPSASDSTYTLNSHKEKIDKNERSTASGETGKMDDVAAKKTGPVKYKLKNGAEVEGKPIEIKGYENFDFFIFKSGKTWTIGEKTTGMIGSSATTKAKTKAEFLKKLNQSFPTAKDFQNFIDDSDDGTENISKNTWGVPTEKHKIYSHGPTKFIVRENMDNNQGFGDPVFDSRSKAKEYIVERERIESANKKTKAKQDAAQEIKDKKDQAEKADRENLDGFDSDLDRLMRGKAIKVLNKIISIDGKPISRKNLVKKLIAEGNETSEREENKIQPMKRRQYNQATQKEQDDHERRMKEAGKKTVYYVGGFDLGKIAYDYANYLTDKSKKAAKNPEQYYSGDWVMHDTGGRVIEVEIVKQHEDTGDYYADPIEGGSGRYIKPESIQKLTKKGWKRTQKEDREKIVAKKPQFSATSVNQETSSEITLQDVQNAFPGQHVGIDVNNPNKFWIKTRNGLGFTVSNVQEVSEGKYLFTVESGSMQHGQMIAGKYQDRKIELVDGIADRETLDHELVHLLEDVGLLTKSDKLVIAGKMISESKKGNFEITGNRAEDRANFIAEYLGKRREFRGTRIGKILQKIGDFVDSLVNLVTTTTKGIARDIESGKVFDKKDNSSFDKSQKYDTKKIVTSEKGKGDIPTKSTSVKPDGGQLPHIEPDEFVSPDSIIELHGVEDAAKKDTIVKSMDENGWQGPPVLVFDGGNGQYAITGSHRVAAAIEADIDIPIKKIDLDKVEAWAEETGKTFDDLLRGRDEDRLFSAEEVGDPDAIELLKYEVDKPESPNQSSAPEKGAQYSTKPHIKNAIPKVIKDSETLWPFLQATKDIFKDWKEWGFLDKLFKTMEWTKDHIGQRIFRATQDREHRRHSLFNELNTLNDKLKEGIGSALQEIKYKGADKLRKLRGYDIYGRKDKDKLPEEYKIIWDAVNYMDENEHSWEDTRKANGAFVKGYRSILEENGTPQETIELIANMRGSYDQSLEYMRKSLRDLMNENEAAKDIILDTYEGKDFTLLDAYNKMGNMQGFYAPRIRTGTHYVTAEKDGQPYRYHVDGANELIARTMGYKLIKELKEEGYTEVSGVKKIDRLPEGIYENINLIDTGKAIDHSINNLKDVDPELLTRFRVDIIKNAAEMFKARAFRSHRIGRSKQLVKGYVEDPQARFLLYQHQIAGGISKGEAAIEMMDALLGDYRTYKRKGLYWVLSENGQELDKIPVENNTDPAKKTKQFRFGGVDESKNPEAYQTYKEYISEQLRNPDQYDKMIALGKSIISFKYLGFNLRSAFVNTTAMVTTVPPALQEYATGGNESFKNIGSTIQKAGKDYWKYERNMADDRKEKPNLSEDELSFMEDNRKNGYDLPQLTRDSMATLQGAYGQTWNSILNLAMKPFGYTEQWNRGTTLLAGYRLARAQGLSGTESRKAARTATEKAHGIYGKATLPIFAQGSNPAAKLAQMGYTYAKFGHNYMQMLNDLGPWNKKNYKALAFALGAPLVVGGASSSILASVVSAIMNAADDDRDYEKLFYDTVRKNLGGTAEKTARYGVFGAMGFDLSGSLGVGMELPTTIKDLTGPFGGIWDDGSRIVKYLKTGQNVKAIESALPTAFANPIKATREKLDGATTQRGNRVWDKKGQPYKPSATETALKIAGFRSSERAAVQSRQWESKRETAKYNDKKSAIYEEYRSAKVSRNLKKMATVKKKIKKFNKQVIQNKMTKFVPLITKKSLKRQAKRLTEPTKRIAAIFEE